MIGDLFWDIATSYLVLCILAVIAVAAFVLAHMPAIIERFWPQAYAYAKAAALLQIAAAALLMFLIGFRVADERADNKQLKNDLAYQQLQLETAKATAEVAERLRNEAKAEADEAKGKLDEFRTKYADQTAAVCAFTPDDIDGLRELGRAKRRR